MRQKSLLSLALGLIVLGGACKKDDYRNGQTGADGEVRFTSTIGNGVSTKVTGNAWDANDAIGVFMTQDADLTKALASNKKYTTEGNGNFKGSGADVIMYPETGKVDFVAYYPYAAALNGVEMPVSVADQADPSKVDVLYSNNAKGLDATNASAPLNFTRKLTKVQLNLQAGDGVATLNTATTTFKAVNTVSSLNLSTGVLAAGSEAKDVAALVKTDLNDEKKSVASAILLPGDFAAKAVTFVADGKTYTWEIPAGTTFEAGKNHTYAIRLSLTETGTPEVEVVGEATITDWVDTPGTGATLNPDTDTPTDPEVPTNPGEEVTIYFEDFGNEGPSTGAQRGRIESYNDYKEKSVVYKDFNPADYADIRATSSMNTHVWFRANNSPGLAISGIKTAGHTKLKLTYEITANGSGEPIAGLTLTVNGVDMTPTGTIAAQNGWETVTIENIADAAELALDFVSVKELNTKGYRIDNIKIVGTTK